MCKLLGKLLVCDGLAIYHSDEFLQMFGVIWLECFKKAKKSLNFPVFGNILLIFSKNSNKPFPIVFFSHIFWKIVPKLKDNFLNCLMFLKTSFPNINNFFDFTKLKFWTIEVLKHFTTFFDYFWMLIINENYLY